MNARSIAVYALLQDVIRCDATVSGAHDVTEGGLLQFGHSKDDPTRPQIKVMMSSLDPVGMPLATDVLSGERADDGLYLDHQTDRGGAEPKRFAVRRRLQNERVGQLYLVEHQHVYLSPLPLTGATAEDHGGPGLLKRLAQGEAGELRRIFRTNDRGHEVLAAEGV